ncbi:MAG: hypothetical protein QG649_504 [Patescibacteria group bacterium]|nr:hypothetical protein [Patescibacteria group bacterium]
MSEVIDEAYRRRIGYAQVVAHPGPEFSHALERFINPAFLRQLGGRAISLRSGAALTIIEGPIESRENIRRHDVSKAELARIHQELQRRQGGIKPQVAREMKLYQYPTQEDVKNTEKGIGIRFKLALDQLTRKALRETVFLDPVDESLPMHFRLRRDQMVLGEDLRKANDLLVEHLLQQNPRMIESIHLSSNTRRL